MDYAASISVTVAGGLDNNTQSSFVHCHSTYPYRPLEFQELEYRELYFVQKRRATVFEDPTL